MNDAEKKIHLIIDKRERGKITEALEALPGVSLEFAELDVGDYVLGNGVVVERKSATDFILSVVDKTLYEKAGKLKAMYPRVVYLVEGDLYNMRFHQKAFDVHRALAFLSVTQDVPVIPSPDPEQTAMLIYLMAQDAQHALGQPISTRVNKPKLRAEAQVYLVEGLPGVDAERAETLLRHFKTAAKVFAADAESLQAAGGVDADSAARMRAVLDAVWR